MPNNRFVVSIVNNMATKYFLVGVAKKQKPGGYRRVEEVLAGSVNVDYAMARASDFEGTHKDFRIVKGTSAKHLLEEERKSA